MSRISYIKISQKFGNIFGNKDSKEAKNKIKSPTKEMNILI